MTDIVGVRTKWRMSRGVWMVCVAVVFAVGLGWLLFSKHTAAATEAAPQESEWVPARKGDFEILWRDEGELKPVKVTSLTFMRWGKLSFILPEGTAVKKGDRVLGLETRDIEDQLQHLQEDLIAQEKNLTEQEQNRDLEMKRLQTELAAENDRVNVARLQEEETLKKPLDLDKKAAANVLEGAQAHQANAKAMLEAFEPLAVQGFGSKADLDQKRTALVQSEVEVERAAMKNRLTLAGALPEDKKRASLQREQAENGLKLKQLDSNDQVEILNLKVATVKREVDATRRKRDTVKEQLDRSSVLAPHDGIVVLRPVGRSNNKKVEVGENVGPWASPVDLPSYEKMKVRTQVPESFVRNLQARSETGSDGRPPRVGSFARVTVKTLPDIVYEGEVTWIDGWARDRNSKLSDADIKAQGLSGVRVFDIEVELKQSDPQRLREGFRANVEFPIETRKNVLSVPLRAVSFRDGVPQVQVRKDETRDWRKVELGEKSLDRVIILGGLTENEVVYVPKAMQKKGDGAKKKAEDDDPKAGAAAGSGGGGGGAGPAGGPGGGGGGGGGRKGGKKG